MVSSFQENEVEALCLRLILFCFMCKGSWLNEIFRNQLRESQNVVSLSWEKACECHMDKIGSCLVQRCISFTEYPTLNSPQRIMDSGLNFPAPNAACWRQVLIFREFKLLAKQRFELFNPTTRSDGVQIRVLTRWQKLCSSLQTPHQK